MTPHKYFIVDVFAEKKYAGNQLAVILDAKDLDSEQMQNIAREMNFSETTFISNNKPGEHGWDVRIFTPAAEVPFAGHPTLGTSYIIANEILKRPINNLVLNLKVGQIPVEFSSNGQDQLIWMKQIQPWFGKIYKANQVAAVLSINPEEIDDQFPIIEATTGLPFIIVPLKSLQSVKKCHVDHNLHVALVKDEVVKDFMVFCPETYSSKNSINARVFVDFLGIPEDPATGSANGCLAAYLLKSNYFNNTAIDLTVEQGFEMNRPSILHLKASLENNLYDINVGGKVILVAKGELV